MQAGRNLGVKVAEALGWTFSDKRRFWRTSDGERKNEWELPSFSLSWEGMGVLIEAARKEGIYIDLIPREDGYIAVWGKRWADNVKCTKAPHAVSLGLLMAKEVVATEF